MFYDVIWYSMVLYDVLWCFLMFYDVLWCFMMFNFVQKMFYYVLWCSMIFYDVQWYSMMFYDVRWCSMMFYDVEIFNALDSLLTYWLETVWPVDTVHRQIWLRTKSFCPRNEQTSEKRKVEGVWSSRGRSRSSDLIFELIVNSKLSNIDFYADTVSKCVFDKSLDCNPVPAPIVTLA